MLTAEHPADEPPKFVRIDLSMCVDRRLLGGRAIRTRTEAARRVADPADPERSALLAVEVISGPVVAEGSVDLDDGRAVGEKAAVLRQRDELS